MIHNFNTDGFEALYPKYKGGRPRTFTLPERREIKKIAKSKPAEQEPGQAGRLPGRRGGVDDISHEGLRILLREEDVSFQRVKTWKTSRDPDYAAKKARVEHLYAIADGEVIAEKASPKSSSAWTNSGRSTSSPTPAVNGPNVAVGTRIPIASPGPAAGRPTPARTGSGTCSPPTTSPRTSSTGTSRRPRTGRSSSSALHGIGPRQAQDLRNFGVHCVGLLAAVPLATVQRLLGGRAGRQAADRARGIDPRPVIPHALPASASVSRTFPRHTLDGAAVRAALLDLVVTVALQLRGRGQAARGLSLALRFAGGITWEKTRRLPEASAHDDDLRTLAYRLIDAAGLQRGLLTGITLKGEDLIAAGQVVEQVRFDGARESRLVAEEVSDRIRAKFGPGAIRPATTLLRVS
ncbi:hypothetical protein [Streptomyces sp. NPDC090798]|uniref:DinB/UmuC family translesion DNA polymerase n=1 Tax=Streptomyces sp. NPDC090798 TaxID=3365968 RepID=UPI0037FE8D24